MTAKLQLYTVVSQFVMELYAVAIYCTSPQKMTVNACELALFTVIHCVITEVGLAFSKEIQAQHFPVI